MELNEILDGMNRENCGNTAYCNTGCGHSFDNCGANNYAPFGNNCCGFGNNFGFGGGFSSLIWLCLLCGGFGGNGSFGGGRCCCEEECCCGSRNSGFGCNSIIWLIILSTLCGGFGNNCGNNRGNGFIGNCGC